MFDLLENALESSASFNIIIIKIMSIWNYRRKLFINLLVKASQVWRQYIIVLLSSYGKTKLLYDFFMGRTEF